ncbi:T9SS type A sorting domain-containing protein [Aridibaculum aurantiacum]|uniref:T9SS type A sorting domain-containing protein n=1 Tax=Aridibaculum aurantiacum TaxID=2810307 RepID=UPI001A96CBA3|nr:T9SS type A sorting domain-containing protein [Aridibaculum aurantiacum]
MTRTCLLLLIMSIVTSTVDAQSVSWAHNLGLAHNHFISALATTPAGESVTAINNRKATMSLTGLYMGDLVIQKKSAQGSMKWERLFPATAIVKSMKIDNSGNIIITGGYSGVLQLGNYSFSSAASPSMFLAKLDTAGNVLWAVAEQTLTHASYGARLAIGGDNEIYMTLNSSFHGSFSKYTPAGVLAWTKIATGVETFSGIAVDTNGDLYVTGTCERNAVFDAIAPAMPAASSYFTFLARYNAQAQAQWVELQLYNTFDTRDELLLHNNHLFWMHQRKVNASASVSLTLQKFTRQGSMVAEMTPFNVSSLALHKFMANRFLITSKGEMVISLAATDTARIVVLDSLLTYQKEFRLESKYIGLGQLAPIFSSYNDTLVCGGNFSGATVQVGSVVVPNANTPVTQNDIFLTSFTFDTASSLPVKWIDVLAGVQRKQVVLKWSVAGEVRNTGFDVERKTSNSNWKKLAFVPGSGTSTTINRYAYTDANVPTGTVLYRLKQVDHDDKYDYSPVVRVKTTGLPENALTVYPNPVKDKAAIHFTLKETTAVDLSVFSAAGIRQRSLISEVLLEGSYVRTIDCSGLAPGVYFLRLVVNGEVSSYQMIKE